MSKLSSALSSSILPLAALALIGVIVLLALGKPVPQELWGVLALLLGGHLTAVVPSPAPTVSSTVTSSAPAGAVAQPGPQ